MQLHDESDESDCCDEAVTMLILDGSLPGLGDDSIWEEENVGVRAKNKNRSFTQTDVHFEKH